MKESVGTHGIEKIDETEIEKVSGGFVGKDWDEEYASEYRKLGIKHVRNTFGYDEYYVCGHKLPKEFVDRIVKISMRGGYHLRDERGYADDSGHLMSDFMDLKKELEAGKNNLLIRIWEDPKRTKPYRCW